MSKEILFKAATQAISREDVAEFFVENVAYHLKRGEAIPLGPEHVALPTESSGSVTGKNVI